MASPSSKSKPKPPRAECPMCFGTGIQAPRASTFGALPPQGIGVCPFCVEDRERRDEEPR